MHATVQSLGRVSADFEIEFSSKTILITGIVLIVAGASLWIYSSSRIQALEQTLMDANLKVQDRWRSEGSLQWWTDTSNTVFYPVAFLLLIVGLAGIIFTLLVLQFFG